jgi:Rod binding domain-containing protein
MDPISASGLGTAYEFPRPQITENASQPERGNSRAVPVAPSKIEDAAQQFESLLIGQMLRSARESGSGGLNGDDADSESSVMMDVAEQQFSQLLAHHGGIGLTSLVVQGLKKDR